MRVISKARLRQFWQTPGNDDPESQLKAWYTVVSKRDVRWSCWAEVKLTYGNASSVGDCVVFNIAGNKYRLVTRIRYKTRIVYILKVMTHKEYDKNNWKEECGCLTPPVRLGKRSSRRKAKKQTTGSVAKRRTRRKRRR